MSNPISLSQMPNVVMNHILEYLDFQSILVLRKVCHDWRNFIDDTKPASGLTDILVDVFPEQIRSYIFFPQSPSLIVVTYAKNGDMCLMNCCKEGNFKKTTFGNEDFVTVFCRDFDIVLRHQKTVLEEFKINIWFLDSTVKEIILESVNKSLKSLNQPLQVKSLYMTVNNHNEILTILPYIDPKPLELIIINEFSRSQNILNIDEIGQLEQWKQANELKIKGFQIPVLAPNLQHFSKLILDFRLVSIEEIMLLKEMFVRSSTLTAMVIYFDRYGTIILQRNAIRQGLVESFGQPFIDAKQNGNWFFRIPDTNQFLRIKLSHYPIEFDRIERSDVAKNAIISN